MLNNDHTIITSVELGREPNLIDVYFGLSDMSEKEYYLGT
jgi:hypothetical protein